MTLPENVPALLSITDFARRCGISRTTAMKIIEAHPEYVEQVPGGQRRVKASLLFSFYDSSGKLVELDSDALSAADVITAY